MKKGSFNKTNSSMVIRYEEITIREEDIKNIKDRSMAERA